MADTPPTPPSPHPEGLIDLLLDMFEDIQAVRRADPAARELAEVLLTYPGLHALWCHRVAHRMHKRSKWRTPARLLSHITRHFTGVEIHPGATIGRRVFIDHGMGVVIGETAVIGDDCLIYKGVVLGGTSLKRTKRHPTLGKGVVVGSNACVLGAVELGDGARVGSGSVLVRDVPAGATVVGIPARVVSARHQTPAQNVPDLEHGALPDPIGNQFKALIEELERLRNRVQTLEAQVDLDPEELTELLERDQDQDQRDEELLAAYTDGEVRG